MNKLDKFEAFFTNILENYVIKIAPFIYVVALIFGICGLIITIAVVVT